MRKWYRVDNKRTTAQLLILSFIRSPSLSCLLLYKIMHVHTFARSNDKNIELLTKAVEQALMFVGFICQIAWILQTRGVIAHCLPLAQSYD